MSNLAENIF